MMRRELEVIDTFCEKTTGFKQLPVGIVNRFVKLFRERIKFNDSLHAFITRDDYVHLMLEFLQQYYEDYSTAERITEELFDTILKVTRNIDSTELIDNQAALDIQEFVIVLLMCLKVELSEQRDREQLFYGMIGDVDCGNYFQLERVLSWIIYYQNTDELSLQQAKSKARSIVQLLQSTFEQNVKKHEAQEKRKKDRYREKKMWDKEEVIDLDKKSILKKILLNTPYIPQTGKLFFLDIVENKSVSSKFFDQLHPTDAIPSKRLHDFKPKTRPPPIHKLEGYTLRHLSTPKIRKNQKRYPKLDVYAMNTIEEDEVTLETLVNRLVKLARTVEERARVLFKWVTHNVEFYPLEEHSDPETVFKDRKATSKGFAKLFNKLCEIGSVPSEVISGHTKDNALRTSDAHNWNSIVIDNQRYFVDCALGAGTFDGHEFHKELRDYYFMAVPSSFIDHHFPDDVSKQYLPEKPVDFDTYGNRNTLSYKACEYGLTLATISIPSTQIELNNAHTIRITFQGDLDIEYKVVIKDEETQEEVAQGTAEPTLKRKHKLRARIPEPFPKTYILELYGTVRPKTSEDEDGDEEDEDENNESEKPKPVYDLLIKWNVKKIIEKKVEETKGDDDDEENNEENPENPENQENNEDEEDEDEDPQDE
jgi:transglutaminase-like putative cysteine protease